MSINPFEWLAERRAYVLAIVLVSCFGVAVGVARAEHPSRRAAQARANVIMQRTCYQRTATYTPQVNARCYDVRVNINDCRQSNIWAYKTACFGEFTIQRYGGLQLDDYEVCTKTIYFRILRGGIRVTGPRGRLSCATAGAA